MKIVLMLLVIAPFLMGVGVKKVAGGGGGGDTSATDGIGHDTDMTELTTSTYPGNPTWGGDRVAILSPDAGGWFVEGSDYLCSKGSDEGDIACTADGQCTNGTCTQNNHHATPWLPLKSISGAYNLFEKNGCGIVFQFDSGDRFENLAIGDAIDTTHTGFSSTGVGTTLDCPGLDNDRVGLVLESYPPHSRTPINFCWQTESGLLAVPTTGGLADPDCDVIADAVAIESDTDSLISAAVQLDLVVDELIGGRALVIDASDVNCPLANGDVRDIVSNTADTITTAAFAGLVGDCLFRIVPVSEALLNVDATTGAHFRINGKDEGQAWVINLDIHNSFESSAFTNPEKDPSVSIVFWRPGFHSDTENGVSQGKFLHFNSGSTNWMFAPRVDNIGSMTMLNTSGNIFIAGGVFTSLSSNDVGGGLILSGQHTAVFDTKVDVNYPIEGGNSDIEAVLAQCNQGVAGPCTVLIARTSISGGSGGINGGLSFYALDADITSFTGKVLYSSITRSKYCMILRTEASSPYVANLVMRASILDECSTTQLLVLGDFNDINYDIRDMTFDEVEQTNTFKIDDNAENRTEAIALINADVNTFCGGVTPCTPANFFGDSTDLNDTVASVGSDPDTDAVQNGGCHKDNPACFQATTYSIDETLPDELCTPVAALRTGESVCRWQLNEGDILRDRGGR